MEKFKMMKLANHAVLKLLILFFSLVSSISIAQAAYQRSYLNFDFESTTLVPSSGSSTCWVQVSSESIPGWNTTHPSATPERSCSSPITGAGPLIELWTHGFLGVPARDYATGGKVLAELNAQQYSELQQNI